MREIIQKIIKNIKSGEYTVLLANLLLVMCLYMACRFVYWAENHETFANIPVAQWFQILNGGWRFDLTAMLYLNIPIILLFTLPCHWKEKMPQSVGRWVFVLFNSIGLLSNLSDAVYFRFTGRRTTATIFQEFSNEGNLGSIFLKETITHWYLFLVAALIIFLLYRFYQAPDFTLKNKKGKGIAAYYVSRSLLFAFTLYMTIIGIRGGFGSAVRPIHISNANQYANKPVECALILNTPFSIIRTLGDQAFITPSYMTTEEMEQIYTPVHNVSDTIAFTPKNVVVLIVESFGKEYIGTFNRNLEPNGYEGYTPFIDSLISQSLTFRYSYSNGRKSIDGMPSILSSIPMFVEPFFLTPASTNHVSGLAGELSQKGYYTAFFHGAQNGSMGFQAFAKATGFQDYYGRTEFDADKRFRGDADFDGTWAIWDEPFLQFYATQMNEFKEPFMTALFTASSHHPFVIPEQYKDTFAEGQLPIHKCIRYTDHALRRFFEYASQQEWYKNTLFVLTADHTNLSNHSCYQTDLGVFSVPILFFDPSGESPRGIQEETAQQIDIMPTVLGLLHYDQPYVAFGTDHSHETGEPFAVNYSNGNYQYVRYGHTLQFDGTKCIGLYAQSDPLMQEQLINRDLTLQEKMEKELKAIIQQYMSRMNENRLVVEK